MENKRIKELREEISKILIKWGMGTRQVAIIEIVNLLKREPCCGHKCCCNLVLKGGDKNGRKIKTEEGKKESKKSR